MNLQYEEIKEFQKTKLETKLVKYLILVLRERTICN